MNDALRHKLDLLPSAPGVYLMKGRGGRMLYVGKALNLRDRVRQYFAEGSSDERAFVPLLGELLEDIEVVIVRSDKEAYLLENELIKKHRPKFNVRLRDDKNYLSLRMDLAHEFPRIERIRRPVRDGARYFGPFVSAKEAREMLRMANRRFGLRVCSEVNFRNRTRPCIQGQIGTCLAPCVTPAEVKERYAEGVRRAVLFLSGRDEELVAVLKTAMADAAARLDYEEAASLRDTIAGMETSRERQGVVDPTIPDADVFGLAFDGASAAVCLLHFRGGRLQGKRCYSFDEVSQAVPEVLGAVLGQYYAERAQVPDEIMAPDEPEGAGSIAAALSELAGRTVRITVPKRGARADLIEMAARNADHHLKLVTDRDEVLALLRRHLGLRRFPRVIECYDISHLGGTHTVAARVTFVNGLPDKERYRHYHVRGGTAGDDIAAMHEVLSRRFSAAASSGLQPRPPPRGAGSAFSLQPGVDDAPDLLLIDGGRAQLNAA